MSDPKGYTPEGVKYTFPDDDPYQESNEIYYNMVDFLDDSEVHQIWEIVMRRHLTEIILSQQTMIVNHS